MKTEQTKETLIPLSQINNKFDVRVALDQDRVIQFAGMYESGVKLPPVRLVRIDDDSFAYIDGRTRGAARDYLGYKDVPAVVCNGRLRDDPFELYAEALESNWGGSKPPCREDIVHTIVRMVELGVAQKTIRERLTFLPAGSCKAYITNAISIVKKRKLSRALDAVADGLSAKGAAEQFDVKLEVLKDAISGKSRRFGNRTQEQEFVVGIQTYISQQLFSANAGISRKMTELLRRVEDGEVSTALAKKAITSWSEHLRKTNIRVVDWQSRLDAIAGEQDKAVATAIA
jgi:hypothetical protein